MTITLGVLFVGFLAIAHWIDPDSAVIYRPLSEFRDCANWWMGYLLFILLFLVGIRTSRTASLLQQNGDAKVYAYSAVLLLLIAVTPSTGLFHNLCAIAAIITMQVYFSCLLNREEAYGLLVLHLFAPIAILFASRYSSYGIWQKSMVLYFLAATICHETYLAQWLPRRKRRVRKAAMNRPEQSRLESRSSKMKRRKRMSNKNSPV